MFDPMFDQAAGLRSACAPAGVRLVPVVLSRDMGTAFDMLWMLGAGLSVLGHHVVAMDATSREEPGRPGLMKQLQGAPRLPQADEDSHWNILAAQEGLESLLQTAGKHGARAALGRITALFNADAVVLVLAPKEWLSVLFEESGARPLVPFSLQPAGVVDAYSATKVMVQGADLSPILVPVASNGPPEVESQGLQVLLDTAHKHLGFKPECWPAPESRPGDTRDQMSQWMLRIVDSALLLQDVAEPPSFWATPKQREALVPQLWSC